MAATLDALAQAGKDAYLEMARFGSWAGATIVPVPGSGDVWVRANQTQRAVLERANRGSERVFFVRKADAEADAEVVGAPFVVPSDGEVVLSSASPTGDKYAVVRAKAPAAGSGGKKKQFFVELWEAGTLQRVLATNKQHGEVHGNDTFGCLEWSPDETKLVYVAERLRKDPKGWFDSDLEGRESDIAEGTEPVGTKFQHRESFGEQLTNVVDPRLVVLDLKTGLFSDPLEGRQEAGVGVGQAVWTPSGNGVVFTAWPRSDGRRLGLIYCINRPSSVCYASLDDPAKPLTCLSDPTRSARSAQFSLYGKKLVWLENMTGGPHAAASRLLVCDWTAVSLGKTAEDIPTTCVVDVAASENAHCLTLHRLPKRCWLTDDVLLLDTGIRSQRHLATVSVVKQSGLELLDNVAGVPAGGTYNVLDVHRGWIVASYSAPNQPPCLLLGDALNNEAPVSWTIISKPDPITDALSWEVLKFDASVASFEAILLEPATRSPSGLAPLIVVPHGGPHSAFQASFFLYYAALTRLGFALVLINYRGSLGYGQEALECLLGRIGEQDVADCNRVVTSVLERGTVDPGQVVVFGGSHGGFLSAHLTGQHPDRYKVCAMRNPVIDIPTMLGSTDIPDWCVVEAGLTWTQETAAFQLTPGQLQQLRLASPISHVRQVKAPTLVLLGLEDRRCPPSQGREWYHALRALGTPTELLQFPDDHHALAGVECNAEVFVQVAVWFQKHLAEAS
eukprot:m.251702 g.251702  ORF g.251702 m.251702 type:complete len:733 (-) comp19112_c0_seq9:120-2318(-)